MRPKYLEIEGLQSFKESQTVNFEELGETGLFGIFGPTGSGKSTILDAITLALYGNVQRANWGTQGIINTDSESVNVCFIFELFKDNRRRVYKAARLYKRKKGNDNSAVAKLARLFEVIDGVDTIIADKEREVTSSVTDLIGLNLDDFTRSVVLPQNKFMEFLMLNKFEKRDMMERIFYLEEYGRNLSDKIAKKLSSIKHKLSNIEGAMSSIGTVSEKILLEAESKFNEARLNREKCDTQLKTKEAEHIASKQVWELLSEKKNIDTSLASHLELARDIKDKKNIYQNAVKAEDLKNLIKNHQELSDKLKLTKGKLSIINDKLPELKLKLSKEQEEYEQEEKRAEQKIPELIENKSKLFDALQIKKEIVVIDDEYKRAREKYLKTRNHRDERENKIKQQKLLILQKEEIISKKTTEFEMVNIDLDYRKKVYEGIKIEEAFKVSQKAFNDGQKIVRDIHKKLEDMIRAKDCSINYDRGLEYKGEKLLDEKECEKIVDYVEDDIRRLESLINENTAYILSKHLKDGTPCPVCGSREHPSPATIDNIDDEDASSMHYKSNNDINELSAEVKNRIEFLAKFNAVKGNLIKARDDLKKLELKATESKRALSDCLHLLGVESASGEYNRIEQNEKQAKKISMELGKLREEYERERKEGEKSIEELQKVQLELSEIESVGTNLKSKKEERDLKIKGIVGDKDINAEIKTIEAQIENLKNQQKQKFDNIHKLQKELNEIIMSKGTYENQKDIYNQAVKDEEEKLEFELKAKGFIIIADAVNAILPENKKEALRIEIEDFEEKMKKLTVQSDTINKKINGRVLTEEKWIEISSSYQLARKLNEESISLFENARNKYENTLQSFEKWLVLNKEYKEYNNKKDQIQEIQRLLKGNSFVEYISEERLRYVAKEASETLGVLTNYRYALELDVENGFVVRDYVNGGCVRLVSTLSGGETFLTSLSLALALSKQIQLKGQSPLEFFFLDEGFGTLDLGLLDTVIDALERLSSTDRVIGLISHVPELKNRIMRKLVVSQPVLGKGSRITVERA